MPTFYMLVGLPASGKSTYAQELSKRTNAIICSSDTIREELYGDENTQANNEEVFQVLHNRIKENLRNNKSVIYDATNISYKRRMNFLTQLKNIECKKNCYVIARPYEFCLKANKERKRIVPKESIKRMYMNFDIPYYNEGWDYISIIFVDVNENFMKTTSWLLKYKNYDQKNSHHTATLSNHCIKCSDYISEEYSMLKEVALIHDCGKPFTQTFINTKGEITEEAHYYQHHCTGSYDSLFFTNLFTTNLTGFSLYRAFILRWYMIPYVWEKDNNEKLRLKYLKLWGESLYSDIMILHEADKKAH